VGAYLIANVEDDPNRLAKPAAWKLHTSAMACSTSSVEAMRLCATIQASTWSIGTA